MTYETPSGARYWVEQIRPRQYRIVRNFPLWGINAWSRIYNRPPLNKTFSDRPSAEAALEAHGEAHKWRRIE